MPPEAPPSPTLPDEWRPGLDAIRELPDGALTLLIGATDRGKTTFATLAARALAAEFGRVAILDADIGQSEIGPPGTVGAAWATPDAARLHDLKPAGRWFVGAFAATAAVLEHVAAAAQAAAWARENGARRILLDTTGFVAGPAARRLKVAKAQVCRPALVLGFGHPGEVEALLSVVGATTGARTLLLPVPEAVGRKSTALRGTRRMTRLSQALDGAREIALPLASTLTLGATLGTGEPVAPHLAQWAGTALRMPVVYAEKAEGILSVFVAGPLPRPGWEATAGPVADHFGCRSVRALSLPAHAGVLLGLHDAAGKLLAVGRFVRLDVERGGMVVQAPLASAASVERVRLAAFGRARVGADGSPGPDVKPGEL
jgi:polynucleotide 5'-hydroxyl-kinase GRC3/NOL9